MKVVAFHHPQATALELPPAIELIADSAIVWPGHPLFLPDFDDAWTGRVVLAFRISRLGKGIAPKFAGRYYDAMTLALIPRSLALQEELGRQCRPTGLCGCFDGAVVMGRWIDLPADDGAVSVDVEGLSVTVESPLTAAAQAIAALSHYSTLKTGDILMPVALAAEFPLTRRREFKAALAGTEVLAVRLP